MGCEPLVHPDVDRETADRLATVAKALADPIRVQLLDVLRKHAGRVCVGAPDDLAGWLAGGA